MTGLAAQAQDGACAGRGEGRGGMGMGPMGEHGRGGPGHHGPRHGMGASGHLEPMLDAADASKEQRIKIRQIMVAAEEDVRAMHANPGEQRDAMARLLAQPRIDAAAIEKLRAQNLARHDAVSKRMSQAMVEAANVLTPEQRAKAADAMSSSLNKPVNPHDS